MRIGVDIDGVLANILPMWLAKFNTTYQKEASDQAGMNFDAAAAYGLTYEQLEKFYVENENLFIEQAEPMPGAVDYLVKLMAEHEVYLVSARNTYQYDRTLTWLTKHRFPFTELILLGSTDKRQTCIEFGLEIFIEDSLDNARKLTSHGIPVLLFDAPYNQAELPIGMERCNSWAEIYPNIRARSSR